MSALTTTLCRYPKYNIFSHAAISSLPVPTYSPCRALPPSRKGLSLFCFFMTALLPETNKEI